MNELNRKPETKGATITLTIVILTWNSDRYLSKCIHGIFDNNIGCNFEIIIVDNNSTDGTKQILKKMADSYPIYIIFNKKNNGVAKGRNQGISIAKGEYILLLDVDTIVMPEAINKLVYCMNTNNRYGLVAPQLVSVDGLTQDSYRKFPTLFTKIKRRLPKFTNIKIPFQYKKSLNKPVDHKVDYVIGACQLIRKDTIETVGLLDENIFYGPEDIDYCLRIWQAGFCVVYHPESIVVHYEQRITKRQWLSILSLKHFLGLCYYFYKHKYLFSNIRLYKRMPDTIRSDIT